MLKNRRTLQTNCEVCGMIRRVIHWLLLYLIRLDDSLDRRGCHEKHGLLPLLALAARALKPVPGELSLEERRKLGDLRLIRSEDKGD